MVRILVLSLLALAALFALAHRPATTSIEDRLLLADLSSAEGMAYRDANRRRPEVATLPSGLQIEVVHDGQGPVPESNDWVILHYRGTHLDGRVFNDSWSRDAPATVAVARTIPGWREALTQLPVGSRVVLTLPPELAYGRAGGGPVGPEETLSFELELLAIVPPPVRPARDPAQHAVPGLR